MAVALVDGVGFRGKRRVYVALKGIDVGHLEAHCFSQRNIITMRIEGSSKGSGDNTMKVLARSKTGEN